MISDPVNNILNRINRHQGQVSRAEQAEEMFILKRELVALRRHDGELNEKLKESTRKNCYIDAKLHGVRLNFIFLFLVIFFSIF